MTWLMVVHGDLKPVLFCFLFSDLRLLLIFLGPVKSVLMAFTACPFWWSNTALLLRESSPPKHDSKDHVQWNAPPKFLHDKISDLFENSATMCCEKSGWSMVDKQSSKYLSSEKYQISAFPCATSFAVSCGQFSPGEQDFWQQRVKVVNDVI